MLVEFNSANASKVSLANLKTASELTIKRPSNEAAFPSDHLETLELVFEQTVRRAKQHLTKGEITTLNQAVQVVNQTMRTLEKTDEAGKASSRHSLGKLAKKSQKVAFFCPLLVLCAKLAVNHSKRFEKEAKQKINKQLDNINFVVSTTDTALQYLKFTQKLGKYCLGFQTAMKCSKLALNTANLSLAMLDVYTFLATELDLPEDQNSWGLSEHFQSYLKQMLPNFQGNLSESQRYYMMKDTVATLIGIHVAGAFSPLWLFQAYPTYMTLRNLTHDKYTDDALVAIMLNYCYNRQMGLVDKCNESLKNLKSYLIRYLFACQQATSEEAQQAHRETHEIFMDHLDNCIKSIKNIKDYLLGSTLPDSYQRVEEIRQTYQNSNQEILYLVNKFDSPIKKKSKLFYFKELIASSSFSNEEILYRTRLFVKADSHKCYFAGPRVSVFKDLSIYFLRCQAFLRKMEESFSFQQIELFLKELDALGEAIESGNGQKFRNNYDIIEEFIGIRTTLASLYLIHYTTQDNDSLPAAQEALKIFNMLPNDRRGEAVHQLALSLIRERM